MGRARSSAQDHADYVWAEGQLIKLPRSRKWAGPPGNTGGVDVQLRADSNRRYRLESVDQRLLALKRSIHWPSLCWRR